MQTTSPVERHQIPTQVGQINIELVLKKLLRTYLISENGYPMHFPNTIYNKNIDKCYKTFIKFKKGRGMFSKNMNLIKVLSNICE